MKNPSSSIQRYTRRKRTHSRTLPKCSGDADFLLHRHKRNRPYAISCFCGLLCWELFIFCPIPTRNAKRPVTVRLLWQQKWHLKVSILTLLPSSLRWCVQRGKELNWFDQRRDHKWPLELYDATPPAPGRSGGVCETSSRIAAYLVGVAHADITLVLAGHVPVNGINILRADQLIHWKEWADTHTHTHSNK